MAYGKISLKNPTNHATVTAPVGFSWTVFFFGFFPPLFRGDWIAALIIFAGIWGVNLFLPGVGLVIGVVAAVVYNQNFIQRKLDNGFMIRDYDGRKPLTNDTLRRDLDPYWLPQPTTI
jgi:hypothetical protein